MSLRRAAAALAVVPLVTACAAGEDDPLAGVPAFPVDAPKVSLLSAGENPRPLRYTDAAEPYDTVVTVSSGIAQSAAGPDVDPAAPAGGDVEEVTLPLAVAPADAGEPGSGEAPAARQVELQVGTPTHSDLAFNEELASAEDFLMRWRAAETGLISSVKMLAPEGSTEDGRRVVERSLLSLMSAAVVFPDAPVGVGGSWSVEGRVTGSASMVRTTTYTITAIDGDRVDLRAEVSERPTEQTLSIDNPAAGDLNGQTLRVESTATTSDAELTVDLARPLPVAGRVAATTRLVYAGEGDVRIVQDVTSAVTYGKE
ncbi:oxidoreductase [Corynebacterium bouchesdurhonense]|uniref:oxidoreductase n=1 Tax=Corynebacterium bouchesdurhonense TaxID=1720192 RepID=UPI0011774A91|nr:oxidoreductase [Corynebacterium bouchesdurhonense]